jgi:hypothetical protein
MVATMKNLSSSLSASAAVAATATGITDPYSAHWALYPRSYTVQRAPPGYSVDNVDGDLNKSVWKNVPSSDAFGDIQGSRDAPNPPKHTLALTQFKALYDDTHLYIAAMLHPSQEFATQAHFTQRNSPIFQLDSDFEVFIDVHGGTNHNYKELEVNALNTVWNLRLDKPYSDQGHEHSGRIAQPGDDDYYEVYQQKTAVCVLDGKLNNDVDNVGALWSVEMALAYSDLYNNSNKKPTPYPLPPRPGPPTAGDFWRINFSRVELKGEVNWTWQPQIVWDAAAQDYKGKIDMHLPDAWGYFVFADAPDSDNHGGDVTTPRGGGADDLPRDASWPLRLAAMNVYYAQRAYRERHGKYACCVAQLETEHLVDPDIVAPFTVTIVSRKEDNDKRNNDNNEDSSSSYTAKIQCIPNEGETVEKTTRTASTLSTAAHLSVNDDDNKPLYATITHERLLQVVWSSSSSSNSNHAGLAKGEAQTTS